MDGLIIFLLILAGWLIGGFINYAADVLPQTRRFSPVLCGRCAAPYKAADYLLMRRCRSCSRERNLRAWIVQVFFSTVTALIWVFPSARLGFWIELVLLIYFGVVTVIDLEHRLILHPTSLAGAVIAAAIGVWRHGWLNTLLGGLAGFGIMLALFYLGFLFVKWLSKLRGREIEEDALGFGDVMLSGVLGLLLGWPGIAAGLVIAVLLGGLGGIVTLAIMLIRRKYQAFTAIPYGPFLILAAAVLLFPPAF